MVFLAAFLAGRVAALAAAGHQAEAILEEIMTKYKGNYILAVEGNPPLNEDGMFCIQSGKPFIDKLKHVAEARISSGGAHLEAKESSDDMYTSIDRMIEKLDRQIRVTKGAAEARRRTAKTAVRASDSAPDAPAPRAAKKAAKAAPRAAKKVAKKTKR